MDTPHTCYISGIPPSSPLIQIPGLMIHISMGLCLLQLSVIQISVRKSQGGCETLISATKLHQKGQSIPVLLRIQLRASLTYPLRNFSICHKITKNRASEGKRKRSSEITHSCSKTEHEFSIRQGWFRILVLWQLLLSLFSLCLASSVNQKQQCLSPGCDEV